MKTPSPKTLTNPVEESSATEASGGRASVCDSKRERATQHQEIRNPKTRNPCRVRSNTVEEAKGGNQANDSTVTWWLMANARLEQHTEATYNTLDSKLLFARSGRREEEVEVVAVAGGGRLTEMSSKISRMVNGNRRS